MPENAKFSGIFILNIRIFIVIFENVEE